MVSSKFRFCFCSTKLGGTLLTQIRPVLGLFCGMQLTDLILWRSIDLDDKGFIVNGSF